MLSYADRFFSLQHFGVTGLLLRYGVEPLQGGRALLEEGVTPLLSGVSMLWSMSGERMPFC